MRRALMLVCLAGATLVGASSPDLLAAIRNGDRARVQQLLRGGADVNTVDGDGTTALMHAVIESDVRMMTLLLDKLPRNDRTKVLDALELLARTIEAEGATAE